MWEKGGQASAASARIIVLEVYFFLVHSGHPVVHSGHPVVESIDDGSEILFTIFDF